MMTAQAASSATPSVALVPRKAVVVPQRVAHREVVARETAIPRHVPLQETLAVAAVAPAAMTTTIITHRAVVVEAVGDSFCHKTDKTYKTFFQYIGSNGSQPLAVA